MKYGFKGNLLITDTPTITALKKLFIRCEAFEGAKELGEIEAFYKEVDKINKNR